MMMVRSCSGRCTMRTEGLNLALRCCLALGLSLALGTLPQDYAAAAEAPLSGPMVVDADPLPLPPVAEAAHQDLKGEKRQTPWLEEAIFTEISPVTVPEIGIALPSDQDQ